MQSAGEGRPQPDEITVTLLYYMIDFQYYPSVKLLLPQSQISIDNLKSNTKYGVTIRLVVCIQLTSYFIT